MVDLNKRFFQTVGCHFVTLSCMHTPTAASPEKVLLFSGFVVEARGVWFYVTAGHILRDIRASLTAGGKFDVWRLGDQTAGNRFEDTAIPFHFDVDRWLVIEDEENGLDYAVVALDEMYCRQLKAGGVVPIDRNAWSDHVTEHDQWVLVGVPTETVTHDGNSIITARVVVVPIEPAEEPKAAAAKAQNQFYGRLSQDSSTFVYDIVGMSGGPIFATKRVDGLLRYSVIGVQSAWYPTEVAPLVKTVPRGFLGVIPAG